MYRSGTVQAVQTTVADVSYEESAPTNGRGDSSRENKGNKGNKGKRRGVEPEPTVPNHRFFAAFVSQRGASWWRIMLFLLGRTGCFY